MKLLTVRQPWATLLVMGIKPIENRSRRTSYRGDVAIIAAAKRVDVSDYAMLAFRRLRKLGAYAAVERLDDPRLLVRGGIVGVVELIGVTDESTSFWFTGPYGWVMRNARKIRPIIPRRGHQSGLVKCDAETLALIQQRINLK